MLKFSLDGVGHYLYHKKIVIIGGNDNGETYFDIRFCTF